MKKTNNLLNRFLHVLLITGLFLGASSCYVESQSTKKTVEVKKSHPAHPHGGPPGQTKKGKGHPGKHH
jgi:hypothetical protein